MDEGQREQVVMVRLLAGTCDQWACSAWVGCRSAASSQDQTRGSLQQGSRVALPVDAVGSGLAYREVSRHFLKVASRPSAVDGVE